METSPFIKEKRTINLEKLNDYKDTEFKEEQEVDDSHIFYSWECVSFLRENGTTLDIVVQNSQHMMALIHIVHNNIKDAEPKEGFMFNYKIMKFKMKLAYESWVKRIKLNELIWRAIFKTII